MKTKPFLLLTIFLVSTVCSSSQIKKRNQSSLTIEKIMQEPGEWIGTLPEDIFWGEESQTVYFNWNPEQDTLASLYGHFFQSAKTEKIPLPQKLSLPSKNGSYNSNRTKKVYIRNGNLFLLNIKSGTVTQLTNWVGQATSVNFAVNDQFLSFLKDGNLFTLNQETGYIQQVTNFISGEMIKEKEPGEQQKWLEHQQLELFDVLKKKKAVEKARENQQRQEKAEQPAEIYLGKMHFAAASLSPTGNYVIYSVYQNAAGAENTSVTRWITESGYTEEFKARPKVGSPETLIELGIFDIKNNTTVKIETSAVAGLNDLPGYLAEYGPKVPKDSSDIKSPRFNLLGPVWSKSNDVALVSAYSHDNKNRWILLLDAASGKMELLDHQHDEAWIGGPGILGYNNLSEIMGWLPDEKSVWFHSEETGYSHLYTLNIETGEKKALTQGEYEVSGAFLSIDKKHFYFTANLTHPGVRHFYKIPLQGGEPVQLTSMEGYNEVVISPDEKFLAIRYSFANKPWELFVQDNKPGALPRQITRSTTAEFNKYSWRIPEFITFPAEDGKKVHARMYRPVTAQENGPAVVFVHGAGYLQNAHKWWSRYFREYMFHNFLVDNGYTVLDIDYRGSAGYGRDWRTGIYRHMGGKDLSDHIDGARMLTETYGVSPEKIGIYGGSYGGFITLMAMFTKPGVFAAGSALRSVTDWAHYNHGYTSNILNTPVADSLAYRRSSPVYFAEGLEGALLMCHGMIDDNVQFQDIVRLSQRLIELGKENWELAVYPVESHGFTEPSSWTDEYKRIFKLFEDHLKPEKKE